MSEKIIIAGVGGQGVLLLGDLINLAAIEEGKNVSYLPSYGPEARSGTCHCHVIYSEKKSGNPFITNSDVVIAMNQLSVDKFSPKIKKNGILIYNSTLSSESKKKDILKYQVPATEISQDIIGKSIAANMVMLGAYTEIRKKINLESIIKILPEILTGEKSKFIDADIEALEKGVSYIKSNYGAK